MPKPVGFFERGKADILSITLIGFLVFSTLTVVSATANPNIKQIFSPKAAGTITVTDPMTGAPKQIPNDAEAMASYRAQLADEDPRAVQIDKQERRDQGIVTSSQMTTTNKGYRGPDAVNTKAGVNQAGYDCGKGGCAPGVEIAGYYRVGELYYPIGGTGNNPESYKETSLASVNKANYEKQMADKAAAETAVVEDIRDRALDRIDLIENKKAVENTRINQSIAENATKRITTTSIEKESLGIAGGRDVITKTTTTVKDGNGKVISQNTVETMPITTTTTKQVDGGIILTTTTAVRNIKTQDIMGRPTIEEKFIPTKPTASININQQGNISMKYPVGTRVQYASYCESEYAENGYCKKKPVTTTANDQQAIFANGRMSYNPLPGNTNQIGQGFTTPTLSQVYLEGTEACKNNPNSTECKNWNTQIENEFKITAAALGGIFAAPAILTAGSLGSAVATGFMHLGAISSVQQTVDATVAQVENPGSLEAWKQTGLAALSWTNLGTSSYLIKTFSNTTSTVQSLNLARGLNTGVSGINLVVDIPTAIATCTQEGGSVLDCTGSIVAVVADAGFGVIDYKQGQLSLGNPFSKIKESTITNLTNNLIPSLAQSDPLAAAASNPRPVMPDNSQLAPNAPTKITNEIDNLASAEDLQKLIDSPGFSNLSQAEQKLIKQSLEDLKPNTPPTNKSDMLFAPKEIPATFPSPLTKAKDFVQNTWEKAKQSVGDKLFGKPVLENLDAPVSKIPNVESDSSNLLTNVQNWVEKNLKDDGGWLPKLRTENSTTPIVQIRKEVGIPTSLEPEDGLLFGKFGSDTVSSYDTRYKLQVGDNLELWTNEADGTYLIYNPNRKNITINGRNTSEEGVRITLSDTIIEVDGEAIRLRGTSKNPTAVVETSSDMLFAPKEIPATFPSPLTKAKDFVQNTWEKAKQSVGDKLFGKPVLENLDAPIAKVPETEIGGPSLLTKAQDWVEANIKDERGWLPKLRTESSISEVAPEVITSTLNEPYLEVAPPQTTNEKSWLDDLPIRNLKGGKMGDVFDMGEYLKRYASHWNGQWDDQAKRIILTPETNSNILKNGEFFYDRSLSIVENGEIKFLSDSGYKPLINNKYGHPHFGDSGIPSIIDGEEIIFRGINYEGMQSILKNNMIESGPTMKNVGKTGEIYFGQDGQRALSYAAEGEGYFAMATFEKPSYIISIKKPSNAEVDFLGDVIIRDPIPIDDILNIYEVRPYAMTEIKVPATEYYTDLFGEKLLQPELYIPGTDFYPLDGVPKAQFAYREIGLDEVKALFPEKIVTAVLPAITDPKIPTAKVKPTILNNAKTFLGTSNGKLAAGVAVNIAGGTILGNTIVQNAVNQIPKAVELYINLWQGVIDHIKSVFPTPSDESSKPIRENLGGIASVKESVQNLLEVVPEQVQEQAPEQTESQQKQEPLKMTILGDSLTQGYLSDSLYEQLKAAGYDVEFLGNQKSVGGTITEGHGGYSALAVVKAIEAGEWIYDKNVQSVEFNKDINLVVLQFGINDLVNKHDINYTIIPSMKYIVDYLRNINPNVKIVITPTPNFEYKGVPYTEGVEKLNNKFTELASQMSTSNSPVVMGESYINNYNYSDHTSDGIHPFKNGADIIAESIVNTIEDNQLITKQETSFNTQKSNNTKSLSSSKLTNFDVFLQTKDGGNVTINKSGDTMSNLGCGPSTAYNVLKLTGQEVSLDNVIDNFYWDCSSGKCKTGTDAVLLYLQQHGFENVVSNGLSNRITNAYNLKNYTGLLVYSGSVSSSSEKNIAHLASFSCNNGDCVSIDSYFSDGKPISCSVDGSDSIRCGNYTYHVGATGGTPDALYPVESP